jgi:hypothetical protein
MVECAASTLYVSKVKDEARSNFLVFHIFGYSNGNRAWLIC